MKNKLVLLTIPLVLLIICGVGALMIIDAAPSESMYLKQIEMAEKYLSNNDYDKAIECYKKAIDADKSEEAPYIQLAQIYYSKNDFDSLMNILNLGIKNTNGEKLKNTLAYYISIKDSNLAATSQDNSALATKQINYNLLNIFNSYTYDKYSHNYAISSEQILNGKYTVKYLNLNAEFSYYNTDTNKRIIESATQKPVKDSTPNEIVLDDAKDLFQNATNVSYDDIKNLGAVNIIKSFDRNINSYVLSFDLYNCNIKIACNESGTVDFANNYNVIIPQSIVDLSNAHKVKGNIVDSKSGETINNAQINVRKGKANNDGVIYKSLVVSSSNYEIELEKGEYTFEVKAEEYETGYFDVTVSDNDEISMDIKLEKSGGTIVITVTPNSSSAQGKYAEIHCVLMGYGYVGKTRVYNNPIIEKNGKTIAKYEETGSSQIITVYDKNTMIDFHFHGTCSTDDYKVNIKVEGAGEKNLIVPTEPFSFASDYSYMTAFTVSNGNISIVDSRVKRL